MTQGLTPWNFSAVFLLRVCDKVLYKEDQEFFFSDICSSGQNLLVEDHEDAVGRLP